MLVPKSYESLHFCIDCHKVNEVSTFDAYPMPQIDMLLDRHLAPPTLSTLDLVKGYW